MRALPPAIDVGHTEEVTNTGFSRCLLSAVVLGRLPTPVASRAKVGPHHPRDLSRALLPPCEQSPSGAGASCRGPRQGPHASAISAISRLRASGADVRTTPARAQHGQGYSPSPRAGRAV